MIHAVLFVPPGISADRWLAMCANYCAGRGYEIVAIANVWSDAVKILLAGDASVAVIGDRGHLPPDRTPRIEAVTDPVMTGPITPAQRRPRRRDRAER